ncbi:MAG: hypothetical protein ACLPWD_03565 [Methanobacterium sp.]
MIYVFNPLQNSQKNGAASDEAAPNTKTYSLPLNRDRDRQEQIKKACKQGERLRYKSIKVKPV